MSTLTKFRSIELHLVKIEGFHASLILQKQKEYNQRLKAEDEIAKNINRITESLVDILRLSRDFLSDPPENLWDLHGLIDSDFHSDSLDTPQIAELIEYNSVQGRARRSLERHENIRLEVIQAHKELCRKVREAWEEKLPELLKPATPPSHEPFQDAVPFDDEVLDRLLRY